MCKNVAQVPLKDRKSTVSYKLHCLFFLFKSVLGGKAKKRQNTFFGYKKWSKNKSDVIFRSATQKLCIFHFYFPFEMSASYL